MKKIISTLTFITLAGASLMAQNVTVKVRGKSADTVFADLMRQTGKNFIYASDLLKNTKITISAVDEPLESVLDRMFANTQITYKIRGNNVMLMRQASTSDVPMASVVKNVTVSGFVREAGSREALIGAVVRDVTTGALTTTNTGGFYSLTVPTGKTEIEVKYMGYEPYVTGELDLSSNLTVDVDMGMSHELKEVVVIGARNNAMATESAEIGSYNLSNTVISSTPVIFGESDVIKTLQLQPGVSAGTEGMAGMFVHGGNDDENLYMLDNIPLYQVNHFGGLFSAFNTEAIRNVDFYKSSFPAKYDGRLSSYMDVHTKDGSLESHHGSFRLGLTSAAFNIDGPILKGKTSYSFAMRRSWYDVLTVPAMAIANKKDEFEHNDFRYAFTDINAKINHHFSKRSRAYVMFYFGDDYLKGGYNTKESAIEYWYDSDYARLHWGNIVASAGWNYVFSPKIFGEITGAYTRYFSSMSHDVVEDYYESGKLIDSSKSYMSTENNISDWIARADFDWRPNVNHRVTFGANYIHHSFLPSRTTRALEYNGVKTQITDSTYTYSANELNAYIGDDWTVGEKLRVNVGVHASLFAIDGKKSVGQVATHNRTRV